MITKEVLDKIAKIWVENGGDTAGFYLATDLIAKRIILLIEKNKGE